MKKFINKISSASKISAEWDTVAENYFQKREFLRHAEQYNPCKQRYYELYMDNRLAAGAVVYTLSVDFLTFLNIPSPVKMNIIGIPASVSSPGIIGSTEAVGALIKGIFDREKGIILGLNTESSLVLGPAVFMNTLPTITMTHHFNHWDDYMAALRSDYRRRLKRIMAHFKGIKRVESSCSRFDENLYELYLQIHRKTKTKLEKLSLDFFRDLPGNFRLTTYSYNNKVITWHVNLKDEDTLYFFFGGVDYQYNIPLNAFFNNLVDIVKEAIELKYKTIDFGQTAEIPKMRMGGRVVEKKMFLYHKNPLIRKLFYYFRRFLGYNRKIPAANVFKRRMI